MRGCTARRAVAELERQRGPVTGPGERLRGWGIMGLPFTLGHVLALRRVTASSIGPPFTAVWHRTPEGRWTFYVDVEPARSSPRYFGAGIAEVVRAPIDLAWTGSGTLAVSIPREGLEWAVRMEPAPFTRLLSAVGRLTPGSALASERLLERLGPIAGRLLEAGPLQLTGRTPNGQRYMVLPRRVWGVAASAAVVRGRDAGPLGPLDQQAALADFLLPNRGLFGIGDEWFEPFDPAVHRPAVPWLRPGLTPA